MKAHASFFVCVSRSARIRNYRTICRTFCGQCLPFLQIPQILFVSRSEKPVDKFAQLFFIIVLVVVEIAEITLNRNLSSSFYRLESSECFPKVIEKQ